MHQYLRSCSLLVQALSGFDTVSGQFLFTFILMTLPKLKYPLLGIMLHLVIAGCDGRHVIARISHRYEGCFGGYSNELTIYQTRGKVIAVLGGSGEEKQAVQLTREQQDYLNSFVSELK